MNYAKQIIEGMQKPAQDRTSRFMARLEAHLAGLTEAKRAEFVTEQAEVWRDRYSAWAARIDSGMASPIDLKCDAYDYLFTIMALDRKAKELAKDREATNA